MVGVQYVEDEVLPSPPHDDQTDWQAQIYIVFCPINDDGTLSPALVYTQQVTGGVNEADLIAKFNAARALITNDTLIAYAASPNPTLYVPPES